jgi:Yip1 domain
MSLIARVKQMILTPVAGWRSIGEERSTVSALLLRYVLPMALIPAAASFIGYGFVGVDGLLFRVSGLYWGAVMAINSLITSVAVYLLGTYIVDRMAPGFGAIREPGRSAQLVAYSSTPAWVAGIFYAVPSLQEGVVLGLYGVYLFYLGIPLLKRTPDDQRVAFTISSAIVIIILRFLIGLLLINIIYSFSGNPFLPYTIIWN